MFLAGCRLAPHVASQAIGSRSTYTRITAVASFRLRAFSGSSRTTGVWSRLCEMARIQLGVAQQGQGCNDAAALDRKAELIRAVPSMVAGCQVGLDLRKKRVGQRQCLARPADYHEWMQGRPFPVVDMSAEFGPAVEPCEGKDSFPLRDAPSGARTFFLPNAVQLGSARRAWPEYFLSQYYERGGRHFMTLGLHARLHKHLQRPLLEYADPLELYECRGASIRRLLHHIETGENESFSIVLGATPLHFPATRDALWDLMASEHILAMVAYIGPHFPPSIFQPVGYPPRPMMERTLAPIPAHSFDDWES